MASNKHTHSTSEYCHLADTGDMSDDGAMSRGAGVNEMAEAGRNRPGSGRYRNGDGDGGLGVI